MKCNVTVAIDEAIYRDTRLWAAAHNTSISAIIEYCIVHLPRIPKAREAVEKFRQRRERSCSRGFAAYEDALQHYIHQERHEEED